MSVGSGVYLRETQIPGSHGLPASSNPAPQSAERAEPTRDDADVLGLIASLCGALDAEGVRYCHWKSNEAILDPRAARTISTCW